MSSTGPRIIGYPGNSYAPDFEGVLGTNVPKGGVGTMINNADSLGASDSGDGLASQMSLLASLVDSSPNENTDNRETFTVHPKTPALFGGVGNWQAGAIPNTSIVLQNPNGQFISTPTDANNPQQVIVVPQQSPVENAVLAFIIPNPMPGVWSVGLNYDVNATDSYFQYMVSTIPTGGFETMMQQYQSMYEVAHPQGSSLTQSISDDWKCTLCKIIAYPLALLVLSIGAGALTLLTVTSAIVEGIVAALAPYIAVPAATVLAFLVGLATAGLISVAYVLKEICNWIHLCDE